MAFGQLEDLAGGMECVFFPSTYEAYQKFIQDDQVVLVQGRLQADEKEEVKLLVKDLSPLPMISKEKVYLRLPDLKGETIHKVQEICRAYPGKTSLVVYGSQEKKALGLSTDYNIDLEKLDSLKEDLGKYYKIEGNVIVK